MLERHHLNIIRAVVEHGTLTKAAETLFLSQSALSHTIKKLEEQLGAPLWNKDGRNLRLTQAGERLHRFAQNILPQFDHLEEQLGYYARGQSGLLRIGMECHPCYQWLLKIVAPYLEAWPRVDVDVKQQFQFKGAGALLAYEVDILITPDPVQTAGLHYLPVFPLRTSAGRRARPPAGGERHRAAGRPCPRNPAHLPGTGRAPRHLPTIPPAGRAQRRRAPHPGDHGNPPANGGSEPWRDRAAALAHPRTGGASAARLPAPRQRHLQHIHLGLRDGERQVDYIDGFICIAEGMR